LTPWLDIPSARGRQAPSDLEFDVTAATLAKLTWAQSSVLPQLQKLGVKIAQSFIQRSTQDADSAATTHASVNFANATRR
jgi:hypothetical protein